jgi:hypothetical protein
MTKPVTLMLPVLLLLASSPAESTKFDTGPLSPLQIASVLATRGITVLPSQIEWLTEVRANRPDPELEVIAVDAWGKRQAKVRLRCRQSQECLPFYVLINWPSQSAAQTVIHGLSIARPHSSASHTPQREPLSVRTGEVATLVIDGDQIRMQMPVICLSNGSVGKRIRVSSLDHKRIFRAEVVGVKLLKGAI